MNKGTDIHMRFPPLCDVIMCGVHLHLATRVFECWALWNLQCVPSMFVLERGPFPTILAHFHNQSVHVSVQLDR